MQILADEEYLPRRCVFVCLCFALYGVYYGYQHARVQPKCPVKKTYLLKLVILSTFVSMLGFNFCLHCFQNVGIHDATCLICAYCRQQQYGHTLLSTVLIPQCLVLLLRLCLSASMDFSFKSVCIVVFERSVVSMGVVSDCTLSIYVCIKTLLGWVG